jgi:hypothetical protein
MAGLAAGCWTVTGLTPFVSDEAVLTFQAQIALSVF